MLEPHYKILFKQSPSQLLLLSGLPHHRSFSRGECTRMHSRGGNPTLFHANIISFSSRAASISPATPRPWCEGATTASRWLGATKPSAYSVLRTVRKLKQNLAASPPPPSHLLNKFRSLLSRILTEYETELADQGSPSHPQRTLYIVNNLPQSPGS